jgi:hypothetical protein
MRTPQMRLAKDLGFYNYAYPAGGCLLTDPSFSKRLLDLLSHQELSLKNLELLKVGRHFRLKDNTRLVVGRDENENSQLERLVLVGDYLFSSQKDLAGPTVLARGLTDPQSIFLSSQITCAYTDVMNLDKVDVLYRRIPCLTDNVHQVAPLPKEKFVHLLI